jgi:hypothetical protein
VVVHNFDITWSELRDGGVVRECYLHYVKMKNIRSRGYHYKYFRTGSYKEKSKIRCSTKEYKEKKKISRHLYYLRNKQKEIDRAVAWNKEHKEKHAETNKRWREKKKQ